MNCTLPGYRVESHVIESPGQIEQEWLDLQVRADCSYFQSWGWIGSWLHEFAAGLDPFVLKVWHQDTLVGMGIFVPGRVTRHWIVRSDALFLNEYPFDSRNMVIEYNGLLADRTHRKAVYCATFDHLFKSDGNWDEIFLSAISESELMFLPTSGSSALGTGKRFKHLEESPAGSVALDRFDLGIDAYLTTLSKNRRAQIRRAFRLYGVHGALELEEARNTREALVYFDELGKLHTDRWRRKGVQGSFANPRWTAFHRTLIESRFSQGEIQLLRIRNNTGSIGYLYSVIWRRRVYVIQTGFRITEDRRLMPGYVAHVFAIVHNKEKGMKVYDLMHGDSLYKRILCNQSQNLYWVVLQRRRLKFSLEDLAVVSMRMCRRTIRDRHY